MMRLTDNQLFAYLDGGEDDPFVAEMLKRDADARARLALMRRVRTQLASVAQPPPPEAQSISFERAPLVRKVPGRVRSVPLRDAGMPADRPPDEFGPLTAFLQGKAERHDLGEIRFPMPPDSDAGPQELAGLHAGRWLVEAGLSRTGESTMLRVRIRDRDEGPVAGVRANLLSPGAPVQRLTTDTEGVLELPVLAGPSLLRLELDPTCEIRLIPSNDL